MKSPVCVCVCLCVCVCVCVYVCMCVCVCVCCGLVCAHACVRAHSVASLLNAQVLQEHMNRDRGNGVLMDPSKLQWLPLKDRQQHAPPNVASIDVD